jgi:hypothetical protein
MLLHTAKDEEVFSEITVMPRGKLPSGIYYWQLQPDNKIVGRGKVVIE